VSCCSILDFVLLEAVLMWQSLPAARQNTTLITACASGQLWSVQLRTLLKRIAVILTASRALCAFARTWYAATGILGVHLCMLPDSTTMFSIHLLLQVEHTSR